MTYPKVETPENLLDHIYGAIADPGRWRGVLIRIADFLCADGGMLIHIPRQGKGAPIAIYGRLSEEHGQLVKEQSSWNPWSKAMLDVPINQAVIVNSLLEPGAILKTSFYADVLRPQGHVDIMNVKHRSLLQNDGVGGFGFCLTARGAEHAHRNLRQFQKLVPHLDRALEAAMQLGPLADGSRQLAAILHRLPNPALLLNGKGQLVLANRLAEDLLAANDGLAFDRRGTPQLTAGSRGGTSALATLLQQALAVAAGTGERLGPPLRLPRISGDAPLFVMPVPLSPPAFPLWELADIARVLVLIFDPSGQRSAATSIMEGAFGLTPAEARVAALIASGLSGPQIATALQVSPMTVKTHLKRCFEKTGLHSQASLSRLVASIPINPGPDRHPRD